MFAVPADALVLLVGPAGAGKSTFAQRHFPFGAVLSSDAFRQLLRGDPSDQRATAAAFRLLHAAAAERVASGELTVVDATNVLWSAREPLVELAHARGRPVVAICFDLSVEQCLAWNAARPGRHVPAGVVRRQHRLFSRAVGHLEEEGMSVIRLVGPEAVRDARMVITTPAT